MFSNDSSDEDAECSEPLSVNWVKICTSKGTYSVAVGEVPGRKREGHYKNLDNDLAQLQAMGIEHVFCLCKSRDLIKYQVPNLLQEYTRLGFILHHYPMEDVCEPPDLDDILLIVDDLKEVVEAGHKAYIHCYAGLGNSCVVVACLSLYCEDSLNPNTVLKSVWDARGSRAIQTVKQYNFVTDFRELSRNRHIRRLSR